MEAKGSTIYYAATVDSDIRLRHHGQHELATGVVTITPASGFYGVGKHDGHVANMTSTDADDSTEAESDNQDIPIEISPAAPQRAAHTGRTGTGDLTDLNNSTAAKSWSSRSAAWSRGPNVKCISDGTLIGSATASSTSVVVTTNGTTTLSDGTHSITATPDFG